VIVAIPPSLTRTIDFAPPLPAQRRDLVQRMPMGKLSKVHVVYPTPFWRAWQDQAGAPTQRLNGIAITDLPTTPFTVDSSPPSGSKGILTTFIAGNAYDEIKPEERKARVLQDLAKCFGPQAADPGLVQQYIEKDWPAEPWIGGAFTAYLEPGAWTSSGPALRAPFGRIYWAGTETATVWPGYFDGAVRSGEAAAAAVLALLAAPQPTEASACCDWTGTWATQNDPDLVLTQTDSQVTGSFGYHGAVQGTLAGDRFTGTVTDASGASQTLELHMSASIDLFSFQIRPAEPACSVMAGLLGGVLPRNFERH
jgi:hypothetical protein